MADDGCRTPATPLPHPCERAYNSDLKIKNDTETSPNERKERNGNAIYSTN